MKLEYVYMLANDQGKKAAIEKLKDIMNDIQTSKSTISFNEIRYVKLVYYTLHWPFHRYFKAFSLFILVGQGFGGTQAIRVRHFPQTYYSALISGSFLTNCLGQNLSCKANSFSASQEISCILWNLKFFTAFIRTSHLCLS
jgi:hypothetical protein